MLRAFLALTFSVGLLFAYQNCSKGNSGSSIVVSSSVEDERLLGLLDEAEVKIESLTGIVNNSEAEAVAVEIKQIIDNINHFVFEERRSNLDPVLLREIDYLVNALRKAGDIEINNRLDTEFVSFSFLEGVLDSLRMEIAQEIGAVQESFETSISEIRQIADELEKVQLEHTQTLEEMNEIFSEQSNHAQNLASLEAMMCEVSVDELEAVSSMSRCDNSQVSEIFNLGAEASVVNSMPSCCISPGQIDCSSMFSGDASAQVQCNVLIAVLKNHDEQIQRINEVNEAQNAAISNIIEEQNKIKDQVSQALQMAGQALNKISDISTSLQGQINQIYVRLLKQEAATEIQQTVSSLEQRADLFSAWIIRRTADVNQAFCVNKVNSALNKFDYEAARQAYEYCHDKKSVLNQAAEKVKLALALAQSAAATDINKGDCEDIAISAANGWTVNQMLLEDFSLLLNENVRSEMLQYCNITVDGEKIPAGIGVALSLLAASNEMMNSIGPEFRTKAVLATQVNLAQRIAFMNVRDDNNNLTPKLHNEFSGTGEVNRLQKMFNTDPEASHVIDTYYGKIERIFKNHYVENRLRTNTGKYPSKESEFGVLNHTFKNTYSAAEIMGNSALYDKEMNEASCDCGFKVKARNINSKKNPVVEKIGSYYSFPKDPVDSCPIENQHVAIAHNDGIYAYKINYNGFWEVAEPILNGQGNHIKISNSMSNLNSGVTNSCGRAKDFHISRNGAIGDAKLKGNWALAMTRPYAKAYQNAAQCMKFTLVCEAEEGGWVAESSSEKTQYTNFLSGFNQNDVKAICNPEKKDANGNVINTNYQVVTRSLRADEKSDLIMIRQNPSASVNQEIQQAVNSAGLNNPIGPDYWVNQVDVAYGSTTIAKGAGLMGANNQASHLSLRKLINPPLSTDIEVMECE